MEKQKRGIENFKAMVMKTASDRLKRPLTEAEMLRLEEDITAKSDSLSHTPDHPPYAAMIHEAIRELNKESGSDEESISTFIKSKYRDLPYHHSACLKLYLRKQCDKGEIQMNPDSNYILPNYIPIPIVPDTTIGLIEIRSKPKEKPIEIREEEEEDMGEEGDVGIYEEKPRGRGRGKGKGRGRGRGNKQETKEASTSDLILGVVRENKIQGSEQAGSWGRGRLRKPDLRT